MRSRLFALVMMCNACGAVVQAQTPGGSPAAALLKARSLYATPVDQGLQSFHCEVSFDWKNFIQKASNQAVPDTDDRLKYLQTIRLSVDDALRGEGALHWDAPTPAPDNAETSVAQIREGMQQIWAGFFQSWNGFATGDLMTLDARAAVEQTSDGFHVAVRTGPSLAEETFDPHLVLQRVHVTTPTLESNIAPTFRPGPDGKLQVTTISSSYRQPPTAAPNEIRMDVTYAPVGAFQIPSSLHVAVGPANFDYRLQNCTTKTQITPR